MPEPVNTTYPILTRVARQCRTSDVGQELAQALNELEHWRALADILGLDGTQHADPTT